MFSDERIQLRDARRIGFFTIDNEVIDGYPDLTLFGLAVYVVLARHVRSDSQQCFLLRSTIAKEARMSQSSVTKGVLNLEEVGLISVKREHKKTSIYSLLDVQKSKGVIQPQNGAEVVIALQEQSCVANTTPNGEFEGVIATQNNTSSFNNTEKKENKTNTSTSLSATQTSLLEIPSTNDDMKKEPKRDESIPHRRYIEKVFRYYVEELEKSPTRYLLTPARFGMAKLRWQEAWKIAEREQPNASSGERVNIVGNMLVNAVRALRDSKFHREGGYDDWEQIFRNAERFQFWLDRYENPPLPKNFNPALGNRVQL